jgi:hypothetical protein
MHARKRSLRTIGEAAGRAEQRQEKQAFDSF